MDSPAMRIIDFKGSGTANSGSNVSPDLTTLVKGEYFGSTNTLAE